MPLGTAYAMFQADFRVPADLWYVTTGCAGGSAKRVALRQGLLCRLQANQRNREMLNPGDQGATELANTQYTSGNKKVRSVLR